jgi:hypothetical protein
LRSAGSSRRPHQPRVLLRVEQLISDNQAVSPRVVQRVPLHVGKLLDHLTLTPLSCAESRREAVDLGIMPTEMVKTGIALAGARRRRRVDAFQAGDDLMRRPVQAV